MKKALTILTLTMLLLTAFSMLVIPVNAEGKEPVIIGFKENTDQKLVERYGGEITATYTTFHVISAQLPANAIKSIAKNKDVAYVERDLKIKALEETLPWGVNRIDAEVVHGYNKGTGIKVAVIDTGIDYNHPDLDANYQGGYDFVNGDADPMDDNGHGTHCAGIIAAEDNDFGVIGVAPEAWLYGVKALDSEGNGYISDIVAGIQWSIDNEMDIISMSLGTDSHFTSLQSACDAAEDAGIVVVAAAGNDGNRRGKGDNVDYPGRYSSVIAVAATDINDKRASWSSTGSTVELSAPGVSIYSTYWDDMYATESGTSMACPHVSGVVALVKYSDSTLTNTEVRQRLQTTADDLGKSGKDNLYGYGLVDADEAAPEPTSQPLTVEITYPTDGSTVSGTITIQASAGGDNGVVSVEFFIDETSVGTDSTSPYEYTWDTTNSDGSHTIIARATDTIGDTAEDSITVIVDNTPPSDSMHIYSIDMWYAKSRKNYIVYTQVKIVDADGNAVEAATVSLSMDLPKGTASGSGDTGNDGTVTLQYGPTKTRGTYTSTVTDVVKDGWTYDEIANVETSESITI